MLEEIVIDSSLPIKLDPAKTIFITGSGLSADPPSSLPMGNGLTRIFLSHALGIYFDEFINFWTKHFPGIEAAVANGKINTPTKTVPWNVYPRLEFVIGEMDKLDRCFMEISFNNDDLQRKYSRGSSIEAIRTFSEIKPNLCHYWMAEYLKRGSMQITANFDVGIENALKVTIPSDIPIVDGIQNVHGIYHYHGVATDKDITKNLGATIKGISKGFPTEFKGKIIEALENGWDVVYIGYGGVDYFDMMPFIKELKGRNFPGKAIYVKHCGDSDSIDEVKKEPKSYQYLLDPFENQYICYGKTIEFLQFSSKFALPAVTLEADNKIAKKMSDALDTILSGKSDAEKETYYLINLLRMCSQLTISPGHFVKNYVQKIIDIFDDWEKDGNLQEKLSKGNLFVSDIVGNGWKSKDFIRSGLRMRLGSALNLGTNELRPYLGKLSAPAPDKLLEDYVNRTCLILASEGNDPDLVEQTTVFYFGGYRLKKDMFCWILFRKRMRKRFEQYKPWIEKMIKYGPTVFTYRTFYLNLCRVHNAYEAMIGDKDPEIKGDLDYEWFTCMQIPDLMDADLIARNIQFQYIIRLLRGRGINKQSLMNARKVRKKLKLLKTDPKK